MEPGTSMPHISNTQTDAIDRRLKSLRRTAGGIFICWAPTAYVVYWILSYGANYEALNVPAYNGATLYVLLASAAYVAVPLLAIAVIYFIYTVYRIGEVAQMREADTQNAANTTDMQSPSEPV